MGGVHVMDRCGSWRPLAVTQAVNPMALGHWISSACLVSIFSWHAMRNAKLGICLAATGKRCLARSQKRLRDVEAEKGRHTLGAHRQRRGAADSPARALQ